MRILSALVVLLIGCKVQAAIVEQTIADVYKDIKRESQLQEQGNIRQHSRTETEKHKINCFVAKLIQEYPEARLLDIYKSCFQDYMGAEHLVPDRQRVKNYLDEELNSLETNGLMDWLYEPCGVEGRYVRVSLKAIKDSLISEELLLDAFIRSANNAERPSVEKWRGRWQQIISTIEDMQLNLPHYAEDKHFIEQLLSQGKYAISHSPQYRNTYHPHYRIIERTIFEKEIKPLLTH